MYNRLMRKNIIEVVLLFLAFYLPGFIWTNPPVAGNGQALAQYMVQFLTMAVPQILLLLYLLQLRHDHPGDFGLVRPRAIDLLYALGIFGGILALLFVLGAFLSLLPEAGRRLFTRGFRWQLNDLRLVPLVVLFGLVTGYREELFFRSYLLTRFSQLSLPPAVALAASSLLFAAGHLYQGLSGFTVAALQGLYFAVLFIRFKNIHRIAVAHALYNISVLLLTAFIGEDLPVRPAGGTIFE